VQDRSIAVWDMQSAMDITLRRVLVGHRAAVNVVDFDDKYIVSASGDRTIKVWSTVTSEFIRTLNGHKRGIACLQYRDRLVVSGSSDNTIRSISVEPFRTVLTFQSCVQCKYVSNQIYVRTTIYSLNCHEGAMLSTICSAKQKSLQMCTELRHCQRWVTNRVRQRVPQ